MLLELAAERDVHDLHPAAPGEQGHPGVDGPAGDGEVIAEWHQGGQVEADAVAVAVAVE